MLPPLRIRDGLESTTFARTFSQAGVVQVSDFMEPAAAEAIGDLLPTLPYALVAPDETGSTLVITDEAVRRFGEAEVRKFLGETIGRAARGFSFLHQSYALQDEYPRTPGHPARDITDFLQSEAFLAFGSAILGREANGVRVQASKYRKGDFLTLHDDSHSKDDRLGAFTLGFTRRWRPDWGGQLLFHDARGDVEQGFLPRFNVLTVFKVPRPHSVAPVAPYAAEPRFSLTGWFIRDRG
jgi:SM-20-related protein